MLNRFRGELGVSALPQELDASANRTIRQLEQDTASLTITGLSSAGGLHFTVDVRNSTGHKLPTGYPSRRAWLHVVVRDRGGATVFESGALEPTGAVRGNDNDADPKAFERHYAEIRRPDEVQIYESIIGDPQGQPTTGLLRATQFLKDNRLLPRGFDKASAEADIAVYGGAREDDDFTAAGDRVRYAIDTRGASGPFTVDVELRYQPIGFRWADNLREYATAPEPRRFVGYYDTMTAAAASPGASATGPAGAASSARLAHAAVRSE
jgi:hypothetical protein